MLTAALVLGGCGGGEDAPQTRVAATARSAAAAPSEPSPLDLEFRLANAAPIDVDRLFALLPVEMRPTFAGTSFDAESGATVLTGVAFPAARFKGDGAVEYDVEFDGLRVDRMELYGVDVEALDAVIDGEPAMHSPMRRVLTKARLFGVRGPKIDDGEMRDGDGEPIVDAVVGAIEIAGLSAREGGLPPLPSNVDAEGAGLARLMYAFALDGLFFKDVAFAARETTAAGLPVKEMTMPDIRLVGLQGGRLDALVVNGFLSITRDAERPEIGSGLFGPVAEALSSPFEDAISPSESRTSIDLIEWRGADASQLLPFTLRGETPPTSERNLIDLGAISMRNSRTYIDGRLFASTPTAEVSEMKFAWLAPSKIRARANDIFYDFTALFDPVADSESIEFLEELALDGVEAQASLGFDWDPDRGAAHLDASSVAKGFASTTAVVDLTDMRLADVDRMSLVRGSDAVFDLAALSGLDVTITDEAALDAIFGLMAIDGGAGAKTTRGAVTALLRFVGMQVGFMEPRYADYVDAVADFMQQGGVLKIVASPENPVPFAELEALEGAEAVNRLDLTIDHED
ncbi:MAG: hypothetical protein GC152_02900 [Alphaproteobacteria bacterium]|nr:hypothetical protein [Alphaproteobacteria bacterium]